MLVYYLRFEMLSKEFYCIFLALFHPRNSTTTIIKKISSGLMLVQHLGRSIPRNREWFSHRHSILHSLPFPASNFSLHLVDHRGTIDPIQRTENTMAQMRQLFQNPWEIQGDQDER
jgi:hypothetical protein